MKLIHVISDFRSGSCKSISRSFRTMVIYGVFILLMIITITQKENYHLDETASYGLSNNVGSTTIRFDDGIKYEVDDIFKQYLAVDKLERFNYQNVWENQKKDVHPPLYYAILHTICSLFPEIFSTWFAASINIVFAILNLFFLRKICYNLTSDSTISFVISVAFVFSSGILNTVSFYRMYVMAMFWVTVLAYVVLEAIDKKIKNRKLYICLFAITTLGALTHYYCIVFDVFISLIFGIYLLSQKDYRQTITFSAVQGMAGLISYIIFPSMVGHMFSGYRGTEAMDNLHNLKDYVPRLKSFFSFIDKQMFGGFLGYILCGIIMGGLVIYLLGLKRSETCTAESKNLKNIFAVKYSIIFLPVIMYFLAVSKMAAYKIDRYVFPVYTLIFTGILCLLFDTAKSFFGKKSMAVIISVVLSLTIVGSFQNASWSYLYRNTAAFLKIAKDYSDCNCLCLYDNRFKIQPMYKEALNYDSITFMNYDKMEYLGNLEIAKDDKLLVAIIGKDNKDDYIKEVMSFYKQYSNYKTLGSYSYGTTYFLYSE